MMSTLSLGINAPFALFCSLLLVEDKSRLVSGHPIKPVNKSKVLKTTKAPSQAESNGYNGGSILVHPELWANGGNSKVMASPMASPWAR
jgi:hypothetical protein